MDARAADLLRDFRDELSAHSIEVSEFLPERGFLVIARKGQTARLLLAEKPLLKLLRRGPGAGAAIIHLALGFASRRRQRSCVRREHQPL